MSTITFLTTFLITADLFQIRHFVIGLMDPTVEKSHLRDKRILKLIKDVGGFKLEKIWVIKSKRMFGGMSGFVIKPVMFLSSKLLEVLDPKELDYVVLHEVAHFKFHHPLLLTVTQGVLIVSGIYMVHSGPLYIAFSVAFLLGIIYIQIARITERVAENFAASNIADPRDMISAIEKFEAQWMNRRRKRIFMRVFSWNIPYPEKKEIAMRYIED